MNRIYDYCDNDPVMMYRPTPLKWGVYLYRGAFDTYVVLFRTTGAGKDAKVLAFTKDFAGAARVYARAEEELKKFEEFTRRVTSRCLHAMSENFCTPYHNSLFDEHPYHFVSDNVDEMLVGCEDVVARCTEEYLTME